jgi:hypothetical protein
VSLPAVQLLAASDSGKGSPIGLFVVLLLVIAVYLLYRSMAGHLRRLPEKFPQPDDTAGPEEATGTTDGGARPGGPTGPDGERTGPA